MKYTDFKEFEKNASSKKEEFIELAYQRTLALEKMRLHSLNGFSKEIIEFHLTNNVKECDSSIGYMVDFNAKDLYTKVIFFKDFPAAYGESDIRSFDVFLPDTIMNMTDEEFNKYLNDFIVIKKNNIKDKSVKLYNQHNEYLFTIDNLLVFNDVRIQIKKLGIDGYYVMFDEKQCPIDKDGRLTYWPEGLFDTNNKQLVELL